MKSTLKIFLFLILGLTAYFLLAPIPIDPQYFDAPPNPGLTGDFETNTKLDAVKLVEFAHGPEAIAICRNNTLYTGTEDGQIFMKKEHGEWTSVAQTKGRPLGMKCDTSGNLYLMDAEKGLLRLDTTQHLEILTNTYEGKKIGYPDDLDIAADGTIYFSDAASMKDLDEIAFEMKPTGNIFKYEPQTKQVTLLIDSLYFANGVALGPDEEYFLFNETFGFNIKKYWLKGPKKGQVEIFADYMPGFPDNITYHDETQTFWVAFPSQRSDILEKLYDKPFLRKIIRRLPASIRFQRPEPYGMVVAYDIDGNVIDNIQGTKMHDITSALQIGDQLYIGSLTMPAMGILDLKD